MSFVRVFYIQYLPRYSHSDLRSEVFIIDSFLRIYEN